MIGLIQPQYVLVAIHDLVVLDHDKHIDLVVMFAEQQFVTGWIGVGRRGCRIAEAHRIFHDVFPIAGFAVDPDRVLQWVGV